MRNVPLASPTAPPSGSDDLEIKRQIFREAMRPFANAGPIALMRILLSLSKRLGATSMTYHLMDPLEPLRDNASYSHFARSRVMSRHAVSPKVAKIICETHASVLGSGKPTSLSSMMRQFLEKDQELTIQIAGSLHSIGVVDEYMIPVYGPHAINAVISFGFPKMVSNVSDWRLELLESACLLSHAKMIRHFQHRQVGVQLSPRERDVLTWIARGKSNAEIAAILDLSPNSVDTYVRRMFDKLGVYNRVSAAVRGLLAGAISP